MPSMAGAEELPIEINDSSDDDESTPTALQLRIPLPPCAKPSVSYGPGRGCKKGHFRCCVETDAKQKMAQFGREVKSMAEAKGFQLIGRSKAVVVHIWAFVRRPDTDFVGRRREADNLTNKAKQFTSTVVAVKPDNDNLAKFLLDSLTGVLFADDAQVVDLRVLKCRDNEGTCDGRVQIYCTECTLSLIHI